tara:strand:+ start:241 stop:693 length:453 start_codon:yes stop_codon:yes gene_type:complete
MSFSVVLDSSVAYNIKSIYDIDYAIDWTFLPEGEYDLTFTFVSAPLPVATSNVKGIALNGLGTQLKTYLAGNTTDTKSSTIIGLINRNVFDDGSAKQIFKQTDFNQPCILRSRPSNNIFNVKIMSSSTTIGNTGMGGSYILILHFNKRCC